MKVRELFEDEEKAPNVVEELAKDADFDFKKAHKNIDGKRHDVFFLSKEDDGITYEYLVNRKTLSWLFRAGKSDEKARIDFKTGGDLESLEKHLDKKKKLSSGEMEDILNEE